VEKSGSQRQTMDVSKKACFTKDPGSQYTTAWARGLVRKDLKRVKNRSSQARDVKLRPETTLGA